MAMRMLIDARHPEETRVAVLNGNRIEEFDFESAEHKQIKGNIYLAKVTRVEPSLQAAFVDFGGNRHGFLAFSEIHPDYYQIPAADRAALIAEEQAHAEEEAALREEEEDEEGGDLAPPGIDDDDEDEEPSGVVEIETSETDEVATIEGGRVEFDGERDADDGEDEAAADEAEADDDADEAEEDEDPAPLDQEAPSDDGQDAPPRSTRRGRGRRQGGGNGRDRSAGKPPVRARAKEIDELRAKRQALRRRYKIQDVIQRRQVLLVQVVKEERGNKGAALTTYLSLAGRYCVLMPNSSHGGGISRKISSGTDRKRLKQIVSDLSLPRSMGLIVRTAGLERTRTEIKRDFDYLARLWDEIRETTLASSAPAAIHSDSDLVKRAIRDIYNREIDEVVVEGEEGYKAARQFMKLLMPSHARRVKQYADPVPLFQRYGAEDQLSAMYDPMVQLKSGGYLVINPTEALVSIDINSGRSTREHGIEQTALNTNLEAAREIARQLRLRDMAGLVVIDFIDMENSSSIRKVEKAMKEALKNDRARIQVGRISGFGLMEMSRQRLRTGVLEATTRTCPHCDGTGLVRTASSAGLSALRLIEDEAARGKGSLITLYASTEAAIYLLNAKRSDLAEIEARYHVAVEVVPEGEDEGAKMRIQSSGPRPAEAPRFAPLVEIEDEDELPEEDEEEEEEVEAEAEAGPAGREPRAASPRDDGDDDGQKKKRRRRRRGGRGRNRIREQDEAEAGAGTAADEEEDEALSAEGVEAETEHAEGEEPAPRSRRRRGGRGRSRAGADAQASPEAADALEPAVESEAPADEEEAGATAGEAVEAEARPARRRSRRAAPAEGDSGAGEGDTAEAEAEAEAKAAPRPRSRRRKAEPADPAEAGADDAPAPDTAAPAARKRRARTRDGTVDEPAAAEPEPEPAHEGASAANDPGDPGAPTDESGQPRRGWWQRTFGA